MAKRSGEPLEGAIHDGLATGKRLTRPARPPEGYKPALTRAVYALIDDGWRVTPWHIAYHLGITLDTLTDWREDYPDFDRAVSMALSHTKAWLMDSLPELSPAALRVGMDLLGERGATAQGALDVRKEEIRARTKLSAEDGTPLSLTFELATPPVADAEVVEVSSP